MHLCPSKQFNCYDCRSSRFSGGRQQDSHEVLRHLMDGVKEEHKQLKEYEVIRNVALMLLL